MRFRELFDSIMNPKWDYIEGINEFVKLKETKQNTVWHHENAFEHIKNVTTEMKKYLDSNNINKESSYYLIMMCAALCHDLGKANTTSWDNEAQNWHCRNHGSESEKITRRLFYDDDFVIRETICYMVRWHMVLHHILDNESEICNKMDFMSKGLVSVRNMLSLNKCDSLGSVNDIETNEMLNERWKRIEKIARGMDCFDTVFTDYEMPKSNYTINVYMLIGLPGSGKNWLIEHDCMLSKLPSISRDDIRTEIGISGEKPMGTKEQEKEVSKIFNNRMIKYAEKSKDFIINNTNLKSVYRKQFSSILEGYKVHMKYIYVEADSLETNYERRRGQMPLEVIDRMLDNTEFPHPTECNELVFYVGNKVIDNGEFKKIMEV